jgi:hypothetical protein
MKVTDGLRKSEVFMANGDGQYVGNMPFEIAIRIR